MPRGKTIPVPEYNRFKVGDRIMYRTNEYCVFEVTFVLVSEVQTPGDYLYECKLINAPWKERRRYIYHERDLRPGPAKVRSLVDVQDLSD